MATITDTRLQGLTAAECADRAREAADQYAATAPASATDPDPKPRAPRRTAGAFLMPRS